MFGYNPQINIDRIDQQIKELERIKTGYQTPMPQPITNVINTNGQNIDFEARFSNENDVIEDLPIQRKTAFICPKKGYLKIKEVDGNITSYELIPPKDKKDKKIEELEWRLKEYEQQFTTNSTTIQKSKKPTTNDPKYD